MIFRAAVFSVFIATVHAECQDVPDGGCSVCGDGLCVGNPDAIFSFPGEQEVACGLLQTAGYSALIPQTECAILPILPELEVCQCGTSGSSSSAILPPIAAPVVSSPAAVEPEIINTGVNQGQCPSVPDGGCSVCGEGLCVGNPDAIFSFPGEQEVACGLLETAGYDGLVPLDNCAVLPLLPQLAVCGCGTSTNSSPVQPPVVSSAPIIPVDQAPLMPVIPAPIVPVTEAPVVPVTEAPVVKLGECPSVPDGGCSVCGEGLCVGNGDAIFSFPGEQEVACSLLESAGYNRLIPLDDCAILPMLPQIAVCECGTTGLNSLSPIASVTDAPVIPPTNAPIIPPTNAPVITPTVAPIVPPTPSPTMAVTVATSALPSTVPSSLPSNFPSDFPSDIPSSLPSSLPSGSHSPSGSHLPSFVPSADPGKGGMGMKMMMGMSDTGVKMSKIGKDESRRLLGNFKLISSARVRG